MSARVRPHLPRLGLVAALAAAVALPAASCRSERGGAGRNARNAGEPPPPLPPLAAAPQPRSDECDLPPLPSRYPAATRVVAIGDLHGDLQATREALHLAGAIDDTDRWVGGDLVVVQTGDLLDRGDGEQAILDLFEALAEQAEKVGGAVHVLNGNHELMNVALDLRYVTRGGFDDFADVPGLQLDDRRLDEYPDYVRPRVAAFRPGGPYARLLAGHNAVVIVGDTVFVHGGVTPAYARAGIEALNREIRCWLVGASPAPAVLSDLDGPLWSEHFSASGRDPDCVMLDESLRILGAKRMVMGHEPYTEGISSACDGKAWRIDVGLAALYQGAMEVLEVSAEGARPLRGKGAPQRGGSTAGFE